MRALVIDDSKPVRSILQRMLRELGFEVASASDGEDALRQLDPLTPPDVVTVNWEMPHLDGIGFLRAFRDRPSFRNVPVIMVSGEDRPPQIAEARAAGADAYVVKPVSPTVLKDTLQQLGVLKRASRELPASEPPPAAMSRIRVLVVDDSVIVRRTLTLVLGDDPEIDVVGAAVDGRVALDSLTQITPDIIVLDIEMPRMNGFEVLQVLRKERPTLPVVMFSSLTERGAAATLEALMLGANDYVLKPAGMRSFDVARQCIRDELIPRIKQLVRATRSRGVSSDRIGGAAQRPARTARAASVEIVVIGVSTGGPAALARLLPTVVPQCPVPVVIVQHMPPMFTRLLAERLSAAEHLPVHEAVDQQVLRGGEVWIAPGGYHTTLARSAGKLQVRLTDDPPENSCRPAADVLFRSAADVCGARTLAVVLTGMGRDGLRGCEQIVRTGGQVLAQDEASSVVWGMPGQVVQAGLADEVVALDRLGAAILRRVTARPQREQGMEPAQS